MSALVRRVIGPFNRVEGDLEIALDIADGQVRAARVTAPRFRGFEPILSGRPAADALVIAPRICGICSVAQSVATATALASFSGVEAPPNGKLAAHLMLGAETAADHLTHFTLFFMPDFARAEYGNRPWHAVARRRFATGDGTSIRRLVAARARFLHLMGLLAGKWPHTLALQPGGTTRAVDAAGRLRLIAILAEFREALEEVLFADRLETIAGLDSPAALSLWAAERPDDRGDFRLFLAIAADLGLDRLGRGPAAFLSHGALGGRLPAGRVLDGHLLPAAPGAIREDLASAWMTGPTAHPFSGVTRPDADKAGAYSWCKAPRLDGRAYEVGALARQMVAGDPLARGLIRNGGGTVRDRVTIRLVELARLVPLLEDWARALIPGAPFCAELPLPANPAAAAGLVEAARGALGHWVSVAGGRIAGYQIIAPTTWNFSPRDAQGQPGPVEQALVGIPVDPDATIPLAVHHVVRSFDPCLACTVH